MPEMEQGISRLSNEILELIFQLVYNSFNYIPPESSQTKYHRAEQTAFRYLDILYVCRRWHDIAVRILWSNVVIRPHNVDGFLAAAVPSLLSNIKSFTLICVGSDREPPKGCTDQAVLDSFSSAYWSWIPDETIGCLSALIKSMTAMHSFSINAANQGALFFNERVPPRYVPPTNLRHLLASIPASVTYLEVELTQNLCSTLYQREYCDCIALRRLLPQLKHLRVCANRFCDQLLGQSECLEALTINMSGLHDSSLEYQVDEDELFMRLKDVYSPHEGHKLVKRRQYVQEVIRNVSASQRLYPRLKKLVIVDVCHHIGFPWQHAIVNHNVLAKQSLYYPIWTTGFSDVVSNPRGEVFVLGSISSGTNQPYSAVGTSQDLIHQIEGPSWVTSSSGSRHPVTPDRDTGHSEQLIWTSLRDINGKMKCLDRLPGRNDCQAIWNDQM